LLIASLIINFDTFSQNTSVYGRFEADFTLGCDPLKVIITETDTFPSETVRQYDFEGDGIFVGFEPTEEISFTYTQPGSYQIVQIINVDIVPKTDTLFLEVYPRNIPDFTVYTCENNGAKIEVENDQYQQYRIFYTSSDSLTINQGEEVPPFSYPAGSHTVRVKGLFTGGKDNCGVASQNFTTIQVTAPQAAQTFLTADLGPQSIGPGAGRMGLDHAALDVGRQVRRQLGHVGVAASPVARHGLVADGRQLGLRTRRSLAQRRRRTLLDAAQQQQVVGGRTRVEVGGVTRQEVVQQRAEGVHVGVRPDLLHAPLGLLGRHVGRRAEHVTVHRAQR